MSQNQETGSFEPISIPNAQSVASLGLESESSASFPAGLQLKPELQLITVPQAVALITNLRNTGQLSQLLRDHGGAILFRGLPNATPDDYSQIAHAFGFAAHEEVGRPPLRTVLAPNIKTANEGPPELPIWPHNEYGWSTVHPSWLTFSCLEVPKEGGATPLISSLGLARALEERAPAFVAKLKEKGVQYVYRYGREEVVSTVGATVLAAYGQEVREGDSEEVFRKKVEEEVRRHSNRFVWHEDGSLSVTHVVPIIRKHLETGLTTWFGNLTSAYGRSRHHGATQPPFLGDDGGYHPLPTYGDGEAIDTADLELALDLAEATQVDLHWQKGDVVLLDNTAVMHSRKPWAGKRTVLAALWDDEGRIGDFPEGERILERSPRRPIAVA